MALTRPDLSQHAAVMPTMAVVNKRDAARRCAVADTRSAAGGMLIPGGSPRGKGRPKRRLVCATAEAKRATGQTTHHQNVSKLGMPLKPLRQACK